MCGVDMTHGATTPSAMRGTELAHALADLRRPRSRRPPAFAPQTRPYRPCLGETAKGLCRSKTPHKTQCKYQHSLYTLYEDFVLFRTGLRLCANGGGRRAGPVWTRRTHLSLASLSA
eukprot:1952079-Rhodomonas_salina.1